MKSARYFGYILILSISIFSCKKEDLSSKDPANGGNNSKYNVDQSLLLSLVNQVRKSGCNCGVTAMPPEAPLTWNDLLAQVALDHSLDMETNNYFAHNNLQGKTPGDRITAAGYHWKTFGENIAMGYGSEQAVMNGWLNSEGHCRNIMGKDFVEIGVGRSGNYWTMDLGAK
jgi:uncharacterized protein YkwD